MVYKNVEEVYTDEDFGTVTIITDKEIIYITLKTYTDIKFDIKKRNKIK
jgi:hypothetical protein